MGREKNLSESLRYIYEYKGIDAFLDEKIMHAMLIDLMPKNSYKEVNWAIDAIESGAVKSLIEAEKNNFDKEESKKIATKIFEENEINESRMKYLLNCFFYAFKWTDKFISFQEIKAEEKKYKEEKKSKIVIKDSDTNTKNKSKTRENQNNNAKFGNNEKNKDKPQNLKNKQKTHKNQPTVAQLAKLEYDYSILYSDIDRIVHPNSTYMEELKPINMFLGGAINLISFFMCFLIMVSCVVLLTKGYIFKRILVLDIIGFGLGIKVMKSNFDNLRKLKDDISMQRVYQKYVNLRGNVKFGQKQFQNNSIKTIELYNDLNNRLKRYRGEYNIIGHECKKVFSKIRAKKSKILVPLIVLCLIYIISAVYEPRLLENGSNFINVISKNMVDGIYDKIYESERACVQTNAANIRKKADKESDIVKVVQKNDIVYLTGKSYKNNDEIWYEVETVMKELLWISGDVVVVVPNQLTVTEPVANVRAKADINSDAVDTVEKGTVLRTTGKAIKRTKRTWYQVYNNGQKVWISSNVVE